MCHTFICLLLLMVLLMVDIPFLLGDPLEDRVCDVFITSILFQGRKTSLSTLNIILLVQQLSVESIHFVVHAAHKMLCNRHYISIAQVLIYEAALVPFVCHQTR